MSSKVDAEKGDWDFSNLVVGSLDPILKYSYYINTIRWEALGNDFVPTMMFPLNPEIPFLQKFIEVSIDSILKSPKDEAEKYIIFYTSLGKGLYLLGDPVKAQKTYEKAEKLAGKLGFDSKRAEILYLIGELYAEKHRYFEWFKRRWPFFAHAANTFWARRYHDSGIQL